MKLMELSAAAARDELDETQLRELNDARSGADLHLGVRYTAAGPAGVRAELPVAGHLLQPVGLVHGGVYAALAESVGSLAGLIRAGGAPVVGANNNTDLIAPVREGVIAAEATPVHLGRSTQLWQVLMTQEGRLVARTTLRTMVLRRGTAAGVSG